MSRIGDKELIEELKVRFLEKKRVLEEQQKLTEKLKELNKKLEESEALKTHFLSNIKNEINNPLASILALSSNIYTLAHLKPEQVKLTSSLIHKEAFSLDFQLRNIFAAAELEAGDCMPSILQVDVGSILRGLVGSFKHLLNAKNLTVKVKDNLEDNAVFYTDSEKLQLIISNILHNAIEYSDESKGIFIEIDEDNDQLKISFKDEGVGIPEAKQHEIYDRFRQLDTGTTKSHLGHGLGLSVVKALIQLLGGKLNLESEVGVGSTFIINIPKGNVEGIPEDFSSDGNEFLFNADESF